MSVLGGFLTLFIGVFMVNESKSANASLLSKRGSNVSMQSLERARMHSNIIRPVSINVPDFHLLKTTDDDDDALYHESADNLVRKK